jgi:hypothetical protein
VQLRRPLKHCYSTKGDVQLLQRHTKAVHSASPAPA